MNTDMPLRMVASFHTMGRGKGSPDVFLDESRNAKLVSSRRTSRVKEVAMSSMRQLFLALLTVPVLLPVGLSVQAARDQVGATASPDARQPQSNAEIRQSGRPELRLSGRGEPEERSDRG